ncbi:hypothetical protein N8553_04310 [bacterium]|nr:hypothetical protein [bacterium]
MNSSHETEYSEEEKRLAIQKYEQELAKKRTEDQDLRSTAWSHQIESWATTVIYFHQDGTGYIRRSSPPGMKFGVAYLC